MADFPPASDDQLEEFEMTLNNTEGVENPPEEYDERTIYTKARNAEEAAMKFEAYLNNLVETHQWNGMQPMTLWFYQRIQDGTVI